MGNSIFQTHPSDVTRQVARFQVYVEKEGVRLAPQVGLEPTTLRLTAEGLIAALQRGPLRRANPRWSR